MEIQYDDQKRQETWFNRGLDFARASEVFLTGHATKKDQRCDYGEARYITYGHFYKSIFAANCVVARCSKSSCTTRTLRFLCSVRLALHPQILNL